ncbi:probable protein ABIL5 isoform X2 [Triticum dicoccoides]|uniref:probable protein ABIL5 isoform X2 n=1 Tax=Triticum dicoccoides TaxID=85692 RepID=UPI00188DD157|nr:probable protein ABIL5 isoform X2 [Triticum dicoccoides]
MDAGSAGDGEAGRQEGTPPSGAPTGPAAPFGRSSSSSGLGAKGGAAPQSFDGALRELKDLQSQLHQAADCCEKAFLATEEKRLILDSTKSYICNAVVAVIDHLGTVSSKLEHQLEDKTEIMQTEQKISFLKQRLLTCEQYAISLQLLAVRADAGAVQYHRRYLSQSTERNNQENVAKSRDDPEEPLKLNSTVAPGATRTLKPYDAESTIGREHAVAGADGGNPASTARSFSFRAEDVHVAAGGHHRKKKGSHGSNIMSFLKRSKRHA